MNYKVLIQISISHWWSLCYLLEAQQFWVIKDHEDAADDGPADEVQGEAEQREPDTPGCMAHWPQAGGASHRLPVPHQDLTQEERSCVAVNYSSITATNDLLLTVAIKASLTCYESQCCCTCSARAVVKQYAVLFRGPSTDWRACFTGDQARRLCCVVKRASRPRSTMRHLRTELSCRATDHGMES